jgi:FkbM family methyltransferase
VISAARRLAALPALRRILTSRRIEPLVAVVLRASPVRERLRFLARELRPPDEPRAYRLRDDGATVLVRHGTPDVAALGEVFYERQYEPPEEVAAFLDGLGRRPAILDLGANVGFFAAFASVHFPGARLVAFEPDAANSVLLRRTAAENDWDWEIIEAAAAAADGVVPFASGRFTHSRIEEGGAAVPAVDVMPFLVRSDLAKIDIEGAEWAILGDERFHSVAPPALALEHHPYLCPEPDPRAAALGLLSGAGYELLRAIDLGAGQGLLWALRRKPHMRPAP